MKNIELSDALKLYRQFGFFDDFEWLISPHRWTSLAADAGVTAPAISATEPGGAVSLATAATDNNEVALATTNKPYKFAVDKAMVFETRIQWAEAATNAANVCVGWSSVMNSANMMLDDGGGPAASYSGAVIFKTDGSTVWGFETSIGGTQITTLSRHTAGGTAYQRLTIEIREQGAIMEAVPLLDGKQFLDANGRPIKHTFAPTSAAVMQAGFAVKAGSAADQAFLCDYIAAYGLR